jgi:hypothetical protein
MVLDQRALHEVLKAKEWIAEIKDKIILGGALGINSSRNPAKSLIRVGNPL